jgi:hypothetical protein
MGNPIGSSEQIKRVERGRYVKAALTKHMLPKLRVGQPIPISARRLSKLTKISEDAARRYIREVLEAGGVKTEHPLGRQSVVVGLGNPEEQGYERREHPGGRNGAMPPRCF